MITRNRPKIIDNFLDYLTSVRCFSEHTIRAYSIDLDDYIDFMSELKVGPKGRTKTGVEVPITPRRVLVFRPSDSLRNKVNNNSSDSYINETKEI